MSPVWTSEGSQSSATATAAATSLRDDGVIEATDPNLDLFDCAGYSYFPVAEKEYFKVRKDISLGSIVFLRDL